MRRQHGPATYVVPDLVRGKVAARHHASRFEPDDVEACLREREHGDAARCAQPDNDDEGGEPLDDGLPDLDLPPGITRPINDWEPDYNRRPQKPVRPTAPLLL